VLPATSLQNLPPVESPGLVADFSDAWAAAYSKSAGKVVPSLCRQSFYLMNHPITGCKLLTRGESGFLGGRCVGNNGPAPGLPVLCLHMAIWVFVVLILPLFFPLGSTRCNVRSYTVSSALPFHFIFRLKRPFLRARGAAVGEEHVGKGEHVALGPMMNIGRVAEGGRNLEGFGADPYLSGEAAYETILGMQQSRV